MLPEQIRPLHSPSLLRTGALVIACALIGMWLMTFVRAFLVARAIADVGGYLDRKPWFVMTSALALCLDLALFLGILFISLSAWRATANTMIRSSYVALVLVVALTVIDKNLYLGLILLGHEPNWDTTLLQSRLYLYVSSFLYLLQWGGLLAALHVQARREDNRSNRIQWIKSTAVIVGILLITLRLVISLVSSLSTTLSDASIASYLVHFVPGFLLFVPLAWIASSVAEDARFEPEQTQNITNPQWTICAQGLGIYANALTWKLAIIVASSVALLVAAVGQYQGLTRFLQSAPMLVMLAVSLRMVWGLRHVANQPYDSPAKDAATLAFLLALIGSLLDLYTTYLAFSLQSAIKANSIGFGALRDMQERIMQVGKYSTYVGLGAVAALVLSLRTLFRHWGQRVLARRSLFTALGIGMTLLMVVLLRREAAASGHYATERIIGYASLALTFALATLLSLRSLTLSASRMIETTPKLVSAILCEDD